MYAGRKSICPWNVDIEDFWKGLITSRPDVPGLYPENVCPGTSETVKAISALAKARCYGMVAEYIVNNRASSCMGYLDFTNEYGSL